MRRGRESVRPHLASRRTDGKSDVFAVDGSLSDLRWFGSLAPSGAS